MKWKKNILKVPPSIIDKVKGFSKDDCEVGCVKALRESDIENGDYAHLGISIKEGAIAFAPEVLPSSANGRYSAYNVHGREIIHKDLPMTQKTWTVTSPNFGDSSKGMHDSDFTKDVYQREIVQPASLPIKIDCIAHDISKSTYNFKFVVGRVLDRRSAGFGSELLADLNLLQENVGNNNVYESGATHQDYLRALYVNWEILPPGESEANIQRIFSGIKSDNPKVRLALRERYEFLEKLRPTNFVKGSSGFVRYFGAQFAEDLVVFENVEYGNALYVMTEDWKALSQKSRTQLLAENSDQIIRVPHTRLWKSTLRHVIRRELKKRS